MSYVGGSHKAVRNRQTCDPETNLRERTRAGCGNRPAVRRKAREQLANLLRYMDGKVAAEDTLKKLLADPQMMTMLKEKMAERPQADDTTE